MFQIKSTDIEIDTNQPFANCRLGRFKYGRALEKLIARNHQGGVISLNGQWGTGKTTFVRMFAQMLKNEGYPTVLFNAWETDFISDPLIALIGELEEINKQSVDTWNTLKDAAAKIIPTVAKDLIEKYIGEGTSKLLTNTVENRGIIFKAELEQYNKEKKCIKEFRLCLTKYIANISQDKPLVFIIDELDRCNPHYAVKLLERVKHLFSISNIIFILSIDKEQLCNSIKGYYGSESIDSSEYLRRFIDVEYNLPSPSYEGFIVFELNKLDFASFLHPKKMSVEGNDHFVEFITRFFKHSGITLRQMQKLLIQLRLCFSTFNVLTDKNEKILKPLFLLLFFRSFKSSLYESFKTKSLSLEELVKQIENAMPDSYFHYGEDNPLYTHSLTYAFVALLVLYSFNDRMVSYPLLKEKDNDQSPDELSFSVGKFNTETVLGAVSYYKNELANFYYFKLENLISHIELYQQFQAI